MVGYLVDRGAPHPKGASGRVIIGLVTSGHLPERVEVAAAAPLIGLPRTLTQLLMTAVADTDEFQTVSSAADAVKRIRSAWASLAFCVNSWSRVTPQPRSLRTFARLPRWSDAPISIKRPL